MFSKLLDMEAGAMKKFAIGVEDERFPGVRGSVVGRYVQRAMKCEDHG